MLKINDVELDLYLMDADLAEKYEKAYRKMQKDVENIPKNLSLAESIRKQCKLIFNFFDEVFGEGTSKKIFGNKTNLRECIKAVEALIDHVNKDTEEANKIINKYSPNRVERRNSKFNRKGK